jgi:hypothetical protein
VLDEQVWADVQKFEIPPEFLTEMTSAHVEEDVLQYRFGVIEDPDIHSCWLLRFFARTPFFCIVYRRPQTQADRTPESGKLAAVMTKLEPRAGHRPGDFPESQLSDKWPKRVALRRPSGEYGIGHHAIAIIALYTRGRSGCGRV